MEEFLVIWEKNKKQHVIGYLNYDEKWIFGYDKDNVESAIKEGFRAFPELPLIDEVYEQDQLFNTFNNRILNNSWDKTNELEKISLLRKTKANLQTDNISIEEKQKTYEQNRNNRLSNN